MSMPASSGSSEMRRLACPPLKSRWKKTPNSRSTAMSVVLNCSAMVAASPSAGLALLLDREFAALAAQLRETFPCFGEPLLGLTARTFRGKGTLARELGGSLGLPCVRGGAPEVGLCRVQTCSRFALLRCEGAEAVLIVGDALLGRAYLLVERVAQPHERRSPFLARAGG